MAIKTAEKFLKDVKPIKNTMRHRILENHLLMSTKNMNLVQKALANFMEILQVTFVFFWKFRFSKIPLKVNDEPLQKELPNDQNDQVFGDLKKSDIK